MKTYFILYQWQKISPKNFTVEKESTKASDYLKNYRIEKGSDTHLVPFLLLFIQGKRSSLPCLLNGNIGRWNILVQ